MAIIGFILLVALGLPAAIAVHSHMTEKSIQSCTEMRDQIEHDKQVIKDIDVSVYDDKCILIDSINDYMEKVRLNDMQLVIRKFMRDDMLKYISDKNKLLNDKANMQDMVNNNEAYANAYEEAESSSMTGVEPYIIFFGWIIISLFLCVVGIGSAGLFMLLIVSPFIGIGSLIASSCIIEHNINTRHKKGIYDKDRDIKDHINAAASCGMAIHTAHGLYKSYKDLGTYFQHKHDF